MNKLSDTQAENIFSCIMTLSEEIYELAQGDEWGLIYEIENKRQALLEQFFSHSDVVNKAKQYSRAEELMVFNKKLMYLAKKSRHDIREKLRGICANKKAYAIYNNINNMT